MIEKSRNTGKVLNRIRGNCQRFKRILRQGKLCKILFYSQITNIYSLILLETKISSPFFLPMWLKPFFDIFLQHLK